MFFPLRDENPTVRFPYITLLFIGLNILVFLYQAISPEGLQYYIYKMGAIPYEITHFKSIHYFPWVFSDYMPRISPPISLLTSMFIHGGLFHLFGNMWFLWIFGNNVEDFLGPTRFVLFYLVSGVGASLTHIIFNPNSPFPVIGASGAIAGILGAYLILFPGARVLTLVFLFFFIRILPVPAAVVLVFWFIVQVMNVGLGGGVAWFAHIGGFLIGIGLIKAYIGRKKPKVWIN